VVRGRGVGKAREEREGDVRVEGKGECGEDEGKVGEGAAWGGGGEGGRK